MSGTDHTVTVAMTPSNVGTADNGFSVERDESTNTVVMKAKGLWSSEIASKLTPTVGELFQRGPTAHFVLDATGFKPQRDVGQAALAALMSLLLKVGVGRVSLTTDSALTKLQILRIVKERAASSLFSGSKMGEIG